MTSPEARAKLVEALHLDLVGPWPGHAFEHELLPENPTRWYLTGYLVPEAAPVEHRTDAEAKEEVDAAGEGGGADDSATPDKEAAPPSLLPSSMGLSVLISAGTEQIEAEVTWGTYLWEDPTKEEPEPEDQGLGVKIVDPAEAYPPTEYKTAVVAEDSEGKLDVAKAVPQKGFRRSPHCEVFPLPLPAPNGRPELRLVPNSDGLRVVATLRPVAPDAHGRIPAGTRALCVFLVNGRPAAERAYHANAFQARLRLGCAEGFVPRPDLRGSDSLASMDIKVADLQYRRAFDFVAGIGCSAEPVDSVEGQPCHQVQTCWMPGAEVEFIGHLEAAALPGVELQMEVLSGITDLADAQAKLQPLVTHYRDWITAQAAVITGELAGDAERAKTAKELIRRARLAADRMEAGIQLLGTADVREAFCTANRAMARQARQREMQRTGKPAAQADA
ncbi:MAG: hypothetical protein HY735_17800, partial [Verrucomicrobia bacterium]|nr:hypothetical protein [Verrucomicrobiota bacterium]